MKYIRNDSCIRKFRYHDFHCTWVLTYCLTNNYLQLEQSAYVIHTEYIFQSFCKQKDEVNWASKINLSNCKDYYFRRSQPWYERVSIIALLYRLSIKNSKMTGILIHKYRLFRFIIKRSKWLHCLNEAKAVSQFQKILSAVAISLQQGFKNQGFKNWSFRELGIKRDCLIWSISSVSHCVFSGCPLNQRNIPLP